MTDPICGICGKVTPSLYHICSECDKLIEYGEQFHETDGDAIIIESDEDMERFNRIVDVKWGKDHGLLPLEESADDH